MSIAKTSGIMLFLCLTIFIFPMAICLHIPAQGRPAPSSSSSSGCRRIPAQGRCDNPPCPTYEEESTDCHPEPASGQPSAAEQAAQAAAPIAAVGALSPPPLFMFPPQGAPQPGAVAAGGGITPVVALAVPIVAADVALLTAGIAGAVVLSVYSTSLPETGFLLPRTVDATATIFTEPDDAVPRTSISRQSTYSNSHTSRSCNRPKIRLGAKISLIKSHPKIEQFMKRIEKVQAKVGRIKMRAYDKLNIACLVPKIIRPFEPLLLYIRCKLGLDEDEFMEAAACNEMQCEESIEDKPITHDIGPAPMTMMNLGVQTMSDCFGEMREIMYGARVLSKIVNDKSCNDPRYQQECEELMTQDRVIMEDTCQTPDCNGPEDDPFRPCFACEGFQARTVYGAHYNNYIQYDINSRQADENFQQTRQSKRVLCRAGATTAADCRLRVSRGSQFRSRNYARAQSFVQSEQYLDDDDLALIIRYYRYYRYYR